MAEVDNMTAATAADIPKVPSSDVGTTELGTSPAQERSSNSHPHDSEYDTASDLEGGDDYEDDDEDDDGESISEEDEEDDDEEEDGGEENTRGNESVPEKTEDSQKKVDEDRSNPQYIPKRGTFYEHDDRTAEVVEGVPEEVADLAEVNEEVGRNPQSPTAISHASKTMKKWQPASGVDRWSHDRFDANEQAPKSKSELVNAYGYDIRNEDAPPRARRRRRYGRGPSKYSRNWEDETAYLKASNTPRKPPKASDFPALNERTKPRKSHRVREEKENHLERRLERAAAEKTNNSTVPTSQRSHSNERHERQDSQRKGAKNKSFNRNQQNNGKQAAMEFKNKQRQNQSHSIGTNQQYNSQNYRMEQHQHNQDRNSIRSQHSDTTEQNRGSNRTQIQNNHSQSQKNDLYNANHDQNFLQLQQQQQQTQPLQNTRQMVKTTPSSNLSARLQQVQNRNDPIHVGSVQMHALANQNQLLAGQQQQQANIIIAQQQQQQQLAATAAANHQDQGRPKRYSSIRRSQHDTTNLEQHQMQQLHMQQQVAAQPLILQDQHLLQANLMQLYHQENLQAQMQALQVSASQQSGPQKPTTYAAVAPPAQPPQAYASGAVASAAPTAYYVTTSDPFTGPANLAAQATSAPQYAPQPAPNYIQNTPVSGTGAPLAFAAPPPPLPQQAVGVNAAVTVPTAVSIPYVGPNTVTSGSQAVQNGPAPAVGQPGYQNYTNYQNYNTVGGTTYFVPPVQASSRPAGLPQRRPTNAIPILPPSEKNKQRNQVEPKDSSVGKDSSNMTSSTQVGSVENIDHIIDNMFVQRPAFQPPPQVQKSTTPTSESTSVGVGDSGNSGSSPPQSSSNASQNEETVPDNQGNKDSSESGCNISCAKDAI